jgi:two-component system OmpR family response regulator
MLGDVMRILIIEDDKDIRVILRKTLTEQMYAVDEAADGEEGFYKAVNWDYDAILLDIMLPSMDGWEILQNLRKVKKTPVLILTARDTVKERIKGLDMGSDDFVVKPFDLDEVVARVKALIRRSKGVAAESLTLGPLTINYSRKTVFKDGQPLDLTAREYALIEYLAMQRGKVISRSDLYEHLFDETDDSWSNVLDVHMCNVRKKLGTDLIKTRRGQGYIIDQ